MQTQPTASFRHLAGGEGVSFPLQAAGLDQALGGGMAMSALHEVAPASPMQGGAALGFALALSCMSMRKGDVLFVQQDYASLEHGALFGAPTEFFGIAQKRMLLVRTRHAQDALWTMEEGLRCRGFASVIAELHGSDADLTATRRLNLAVQAGEGLGLVLRVAPDLNHSAALTRWEVASAPGQGDAFGGLGRTGFVLDLTKNKRGPCGRWGVEWDQHERCFRSAHSLGVAAPSARRQNLTRRAG